MTIRSRVMEDIQALRHPPASIEVYHRLPATTLGWILAPSHVGRAAPPMHAPNTPTAATRPHPRTLCFFLSPSLHSPSPFTLPTHPPSIPSNNNVCRQGLRRCVFNPIPSSSHNIITSTRHKHNRTNPRVKSCLRRFLLLSSPATSTPEHRSSQSGPFPSFLLFTLLPQCCHADLLGNLSWNTTDEVLHQVCIISSSLPVISYAHTCSCSCVICT